MEFYKFAATFTLKIPCILWLYILNLDSNRLWTRNTVREDY